MERERSPERLERRFVPTCNSHEFAELVVHAEIIRMISDQFLSRQKRDLGTSRVPVKVREQQLRLDGPRSQRDRRLQ